VNNKAAFAHDLVQFKHCCCDSAGFLKSMNIRPKVLLLIPHLGGGGAERVIELLARGISAEKYEIHLGVITQAKNAIGTVPALVVLHALGAKRVRAGACKLLRLVRQLKPEIVISGMFHLNFLVLLMRPLFARGTRVLIRQNGMMTASLQFGRDRWYTRPLYRLLYRRADQVICQTEEMAEDLVQQLGLARERVLVLPNPIDVEEIRSAMVKGGYRWTGTGPHLLAVGRLSREKGFDLLLQAIALVKKEFAEAELLIVGSGSEETALKAKRAALGLEAAVHLAGQVVPPWPLFAEATLFVLSSRHEGLPNALLEAAAAGLPIVALPASGGLAGLLRDREGVWLAPEISAEALASALLAALRALRPGERFQHAYIEQFELGRAIAAYEAAIDASLAGTRRGKEH